MDIKATRITACKACNSTDLFWCTSNIVTNGIQQGRLNTSDVSCKFVLGCNFCSETLTMVGAEDIATLMTSQIADQNPASPILSEQES